MGSNDGNQKSSAMLMTLDTRMICMAPRAMDMTFGDRFSSYREFREVLASNCK
jgi:hypothetical protein